MRKALIYLALISVIACTKKVDMNDIEKIKGYWQITQAETKDGLEKDYSINENYEYFDLVKNVGFHKKVRWQPMGKFLVDDLQEKMEVSEKDGKVILNFSSSFGKHQEEIIELTDSLLVLKNTEGIEFEYKKVNINNTPSYGKKAE